MVVPYGDPRHPNYLKNAFDAGEDGVGIGVHSLELGCDCVGHIYYFDVMMCDGNGTPYTVTNAICMHEEDEGMNDSFRPC
jgi:primary-amine oxidase